MATTNRALNDGFGPDAGQWRGAASISVPPVFPPTFNDELTAVVDWAAFAPGNFAQYLSDEGLDPNLDPSGPFEVVYAYQIVSITAAVPGVSLLTVGVDDTDARGSVLPPTSIPTGGGSEAVPTNGGDQTTSMAWEFDLLQVGDTTGLLVFSSPFAPELDFLSVQSGSAGPNPSPLVASISDRLFEQEIPEPATSLLLLWGGLGIVGSMQSFRRYQRR